MVKKYVYILTVIFFTAIAVGCEDDPVLDDTSTSDDKGSYGKLRIDDPNDETNDSDKKEENHEVF